MRPFLAALVVCLYLASVEATKLKDQEGHFNDIRQRLGRFRDDKIYLDLYKVYAKAFVLPKHKERDNDDYRNYLPSGDECMTFFRSLRIDNYVLNDLDQFVVLDACLGYLYQNEYQEKDLETSATLRDNLDDYKNDEKLKALWDNANIDGLSEPSKKCVGNLLLNSIEVKKQFSDVVCNNHWLDLFNRFAACQGEIQESIKSGLSSSYLTVLYDLVKVRAKECFDNEINALNRAVRQEYINNPFSILVNKVSYWDVLRKQKGDRKYPDRLANILRAVQGTEGTINIREVAGIIRGVAQQEVEIKNRLLKNLAKNADRCIKPNGWHIHKATKGVNDPEGVQRYDNLVDDMCSLFRASDSENFYDFVTPFIRMVTMLKYPEIFDISQDTFVDKVLRHSFETGALYLTVSSCNILAFTEGKFVKLPQNHELHYKVTFKPNLNRMIQWPDVGYY